MLSKHYFFIGIGGIGMSGIAALLLERGVRVSGSDIKESPITRDLVRLGAAVYIGHGAQNIKDVDIVVYSSAIKEDNPEIIEARRRRIALIKRAQALAELMRDKQVITIAGSHGKTTTTSLVSYLLIEAGLKPSVAIGGILRNIDTNAYSGQGDYFVAEADESDGSFLFYEPKYSIITNIDHEHLDYYGNFKNEVYAFGQFLNKTSHLGCAFVCSDDPALAAMSRDYKKKCVSFGLNKNPGIYPTDIRMNGLSSEFNCYYKDNFIGKFVLSLGGKHNVSNALAVIALGVELGIDLEIIKKVLLNYKGAKRRIEIKFHDNKCMIVDDYAHHPTEIKATLAALRNLNTRRLVVVFQPHRFSRTKMLAKEFGQSFDLADCVILTDIYSAGEPAQEGVSSSLIFDSIKKHYPSKELYYLPRSELVNFILKFIKQDDIIATLGAGDIVKIGEELADRL